MSKSSSNSSKNIDFFASKGSIIHFLEILLGGKVVPMYVEVDGDELLYNVSRHYKKILKSNMICYSDHITKQSPINKTNNSSSSNSNNNVDVLKLPSVSKLEKIVIEEDKVKISINTIISYCWIRNIMTTNVEGWRKDSRYLELSKLKIEKIDICKFFDVKGNIFCTWEILCLICIGAYFQSSVPKSLHIMESKLVVVPYNWKYIIEFDMYMQKITNRGLSITHKLNGNKFVYAPLEVLSRYISTVHMDRAVVSYKCIRDTFY